MANAAQNFLGHLLNTVITTAGVLGVAWFGGWFDAQSASSAARPDEMRVLFNRIESLEAQVKGLTDQYLAVRAENTLLKIQLDNEFGSSPRATLWTYIEALDTPAWCKEWKEPDFKMAYINHAYEVFYDVTKERYIGSSDFDIHPVKIAQVWHENDLRAYQRKGFVRFREVVAYPDGRQVPHSFWKFYLRLPSDQGELICGVQLD